MITSEVYCFKEEVENSEMVFERRVICKNAFDRLKKQLDFLMLERERKSESQESDHKTENCVIVAFDGLLAETCSSRGKEI
jgi:hypothetical protein